MKNLILIFLIGTFVSVFISCSGRNTEKERADSIRIADSIASAQVAKYKAEQARLDSIREDSIKNMAAGLSFQTFISPKKMEMGGITLQLFSPLKTVASNLASLGFELIDSRTFTRHDYFDGSGDGEDVTARLDNYKKMVKDHLTLVSIESQGNTIIDISITFPQSKDVEVFKQTVKGKLKDNRHNMWQLEIKYEGNKVIMKESEA